MTKKRIETYKVNCENCGFGTGFTNDEFNGLERKTIDDGIKRITEILCPTCREALDVIKITENIEQIEVIPLIEDLPIPIKPPYNQVVITRMGKNSSRPLRMIYKNKKVIPLLREVVIDCVTRMVDESDINHCLRLFALDILKDVSLTFDEKYPEEADIHEQVQKDFIYKE